MGRSKSMDFSPEEFQKLSREERQLRGRMSSLLRMIKRREETIEELMKPVKIKLKEIEEIKVEFESLKGQIKNMGFDFPSFRVESYWIKDKSYFRGVWYVESKKFQHYIGSEKSVQQIVWEKYPNIKLEVELDKVLDCYLEDLQLSYWNKQYEVKNDEK
jgi:hypothetical protein